MSRSADIVHQEVLSLLPGGWIWPREPGSLLAAVLRPLAEEAAELEATAEAMLAQLDPRTATLCLTDFERVLGADPCGRDLATMTVPERQQLAHQRWTARGGQSIAYFTALAARRGIEIRIKEARPSQVGVLTAGAELVESREQFVWRVELLLGAWDYFRAGEHTAGELLYWFDLSDVDCDLRRLKPAHTELVTAYLPDWTELAELWAEGEPLFAEGEILAATVSEGA